MEIGIYLLKSVAILTIFYVVYFIFLRKDTLFTAKRHYLLGGILASLVLPFLEFTKTIYKDAPVFEAVTISEGVTTHTGNTVAMATTTPIDWWQAVLAVYILGVLLMLGRLVYQLFSLLRLIGTYPSEKRHNYTFVKVPESIAPFSFFRYIVYNPTAHTQEELEMILKHEQVHVSQWHSVDIIIGNVVRILQWVNPFSWLYKKSLEENLEYIADHQTVAQVPSKKQYQLTLVKASSPLHIPALTTQFYQSFIKKRIIMLNKSTSKRRNIWKLSIVLPAIAIFLWSFNVKEVVTYKETNTEVSEKGNNQPIFNILATSTEEQLNNMEHYFEDNHPEALIKIKDRSRDSEGKLVRFSFNTKFKSNDRFYKRFEIGKAKNNSFEGYRLRFTEGPALFVEHLTNDAERFKITAERLQVVSDLAILQDDLQIKSEPILGENPLYIINGTQYTKQDLPEHQKMSNDGGIELYNKKEAVEKYGEKGKDGAMHFKGETTFIDEKEVEDQNETEKEQELELAKENQVKLALLKESRYEITKNTSDKEFNRIKQEMKDVYDVELSYAATRNNAQEITSITITYTSKSGNSGSYSVNDEGPIDDFTLFYSEDGRSGFWSEKSEERKKERLARMEERKMEMKLRQEEMKERREKITERRTGMEERNNNLAKRTEKEMKRVEKEMKLREKELAKRYKEGANRSKNRTISRSRSGNTNSFTYSSDDNGAENAIIIDKDTSDSTLAKIKTKMAAKGVTFNYSKVKRNSLGEITRIKITTNNGKGSKTTISSSADDGEAIDEILIEI